MSREIAEVEKQDVSFYQVIKKTIQLDNSVQKKQKLTPWSSGLNAVIVIDTVSGQNLLAPLRWVLGNTALSPTDGSWQAVLNFSHISIKLKTKKKKRKFQQHSIISASPDCLRTYSASVAFLRGG